MKRPGAGKFLAAAVLLLGRGLFFAGAQEEEGNLGARLAQDAAETSPERHRREITEEASPRLFNMNIWDTEVSLFIKGYWKGALSVNWGMANTPLGTAPESDDSPVLFTQEADLTLSLWIWEKWFLEVSFLDDYDLNTYRAGYQGFPGETIQYAGIGNTGLDFPAFPYLDLGGDSPSSFGFYGRFGSGELTFHTLVRYDAAAREERTFVGNRERNFSTLMPDKPLRGRSFVLPRENIPSVPVVYLEDKNGGLSGGSRRWRLAGPSEYAVSARHGLVELVREHPGMVAVSYAGGYSLGTYTPPGGFLGDVQEYFDDTGTGIMLGNYPQPGQTTAPLGTPANIPGTVTINGVSALVIYEPGTFSPFERQSRYMAPSSNTEDAALIRLSNGERIEDYEVISAAGLTLALDISLYSVTGDETGRNIFEITRTGTGGRDRRAPESMWPLEDYPELYLPGTQKFTGDIRIRFTNYGPPGAYTIGTDLIPGSVQVYRGGILDSQISYDPGGGTVTLASPVGFNEVIRISYLKRSNERRLGSLAAGVGLMYKPEDSPFSAEAALGLRWNVSQEAFTEEGSSSPGTVGFGGKTSWNYENLRASLALGFGFEQPDTTGLYRVAGMEGNSELVLGVSTTAGFISEKPAQVNPPFPSNSNLPTTPSIPPVNWANRVPLVYRNYRETNFLGASELKNIDWSAPVVSGLTGPYPAGDSSIGTDVFVAEFENLGGGQWTGFQVPLGQDGALLEQAKAVVVPIRFYNFDLSSPDILVLAQFGALAEEGSGGVENPSRMVEAPVFYGIPLPSGWVRENNINATSPVSYMSNVAITLTDEMKRKLQNAGQMRILIINTGSSPFSGRVLAGKPFVMGASWRAITLDGGKIKAAPGTEVSVMERRDGTLRSNKINRLHESISNHVLEVTWNSVAAAGTDGRTPAIPLSNYRVLSFYLRGNSTAFPPGSMFHFMISRGPDSYGDPGKTALELTAPLDGALFGEDRWYSVEIHYGTDRRRFLVDGHEYPGTIHYRPGALRQSSLGEGDFTGDGQSGYAAALFTGLSSSSGSFSIDEICLEDPSPSFRVNGGGTLDWTHPGTLVKAGDTEVLSNPAFSTALESAVRGDPFNSQAETFSGVQSRSQGEISILGFKTQGNLQFMASNDVSYWSAGHGLSRSFGPLFFSESFNTAPYDETMDHTFSLGLETLVFGNLSSSMVYQNHRLNRVWTGSTGIKGVQNSYPGFSLEGNLRYTEKNGKIPEWMPHYAKTWAQSWTLMAPDSGADPSGGAMLNRYGRTRAGVFFNYLPVGADISFEGTSDVSVPMEVTKSSSTVRIDLPFSFNPIRGNLRSQRIIFRSLMYSGGNLGDDLFQYGQSLSDTAPLWGAVPVYSLFDANLDSAMDRTLAKYTLEAENTRFNEILLLNLFFPERYDLGSLAVPINLFTQLDRTMEQRLDTRLDVFTLSSGLGFSSINLFGAMGVYPVFRFYQNDELRHSITGIISFPESEEPQWRIQAEQSLGIYGFKGAELAINNAITAVASGWTENVTLLWTVPREKTLLSSIYGAIIRKAAGNSFFPLLDELAGSDYERLIRESLEFIADHSGTKGIYSVILGHESLVRILGRLTLTGFAKLDFTRNRISELTSIMLRFGTTLTVSF